MNKLPLFYLLLGLCLFYNTRCISLAGVGRSGFSREVPNVKNTYLKFNIRNYKDRKNYDPDSWFYKINQFILLVEWFDSEPPFPYTKNSGYSFPINPPESYYQNKEDKIGRMRIRQILNGDRRDYFIFDCEYWMPMPAGLGKFKFYMNDYENGRISEVTKELNLPENHSIRLAIHPARIDYSKYPPTVIHLQVGENKNSQEGRKGFAFEFQIEENKPGDVEPKCNVDSSENR
ncbi:hypothetical protein EHO59_08605 [Leptospira semungkisensis]|uniref:Uncharacterized protein n=1 Tax=Leptospira semungkisensis TaxID=2484985 RepID=A0A4R9G133_9LEPT|nr:hypothetical protein [Leptospira semungkisensis]TGK04903.1 hypothetical protein EHO59_08605 [Leptospira semungkisensis]